MTEYLNDVLIKSLQSMKLMFHTQKENSSYLFISILCIMRILILNIHLDDSSLNVQLNRDNWGLEKEMATHSSTLAWETPWTEEPDRLQFMGSQSVGHD